MLQFLPQIYFNLVFSHLNHFLRFSFLLFPMLSLYVAFIFCPTVIFFCKMTHIFSLFSYITFNNCTFGKYSRFNTNVSIKGAIQLYQETEDSALFLIGVATNISPDGLHGFHIHQFGNLSDSCKGAGPHFNPDGVRFLQYVICLMWSLWDQKKLITLSEW
jgi:hypothetical protein